MLKALAAITLLVSPSCSYFDSNSSAFPVVENTYVSPVENLDNGVYALLPDGDSILVGGLLEKDLESDQISSPFENSDYPALGNVIRISQNGKILSGYITSKGSDASPVTNYYYIDLEREQYTEYIPPTSSGVLTSLSPWQSALAYADSFSYDDWRVPNVKELQSIVDYSGVYPAINTSYFSITDEDAYFWSSTSAFFSPETPGYYYAWYVAFGYAVGPDGTDVHGAGAVRFDTKAEGGPAGEDPERIFNYVRLVRGGNVTETPEGDPTADDTVTFVESNKGEGSEQPGGQAGPGDPNQAGGPSNQQGGPGGQPTLHLAAAAAQLGVTEEALQTALGDPSQGPPDFATIAAALGVSESDLLDALGISGGGQPSPCTVRILCFC